MSQPTAQDFAHIPGWGIDADPRNNPVYPMNERPEGFSPEREYARPTLQHDEVELLQSIERPSPSAVYGTTVPPAGLSGMIRRGAFRYSENRYRHWLPLLLADRVQVVEGILSDLAHGHLPNIWKEKGYNAEWKHNPQLLITKLSVVAVGIAGIVTLIATSGKKNKTYKSGAAQPNPRIRSASRR